MSVDRVSWLEFKIKEHESRLEELRSRLHDAEDYVIYLGKTQLELLRVIRNVTDRIEVKK